MAGRYTSAREDGMREVSSRSNQVQSVAIHLRPEDMAYGKSPAVQLITSSWAAAAAVVVATAAAAEAAEAAIAVGRRER